MLKDRKLRTKKNHVSQFLLKLLLITLYGEQIRKDIKEKFVCESEDWMILSEYDERVKNYWKISHCFCFVKMIDDKGLEDEVKISIPCLFVWVFCIIKW